MSIATITSKGQVTLPKEIRAALRLETGQKLDFHLTDAGTVIIRPVTKRVADIFVCLENKTRRGATIEEMNAAIANRQRSDWR